MFEDEIEEIVEEDFDDANFEEELELDDVIDADEKSDKPIETDDEEEENDEDDKIDKDVGLEVEEDEELIESAYNKFKTHSNEELLLSHSKVKIATTNKTTPYLTIYEKAKIIGMRAEQICREAPIMIDTDEIDPLIIAELEFDAQKIPIAIQRPTINKQFETWLLKDLNL